MDIPPCQFRGCDHCREVYLKEFLDQVASKPRVIASKLVWRGSLSDVVTDVITELRAHAHEMEG